MKTYLILNILLLTANVLAAASNNMCMKSSNKSVRGCIGWGFFAEFLWVINHLNWCEKSQQIPVVHWDEKFAYYSPNGFNGSKNVWQYYFEPVSNKNYMPGDKLHTNLYYTNFSAILPYYQYIESMERLCTDKEKKSFKSVLNVPLKALDDRGPVGKKHLYSTEFRTFVNKKYIKPYIKIKSPIRKKINAFYTQYMLNKKTIGIHLRGKFIWNEVNYVPTSVLLEEANKYADGSTQFFVATDQYPLIQEAKKNLKGKVIYYTFPRSSETTSPIAGGKKLHPQEGENILIEMMLLSRCNHLVHTLSNVSTTALYFNPTLPHTVLY